jgi:hypothetical protein
MDTEWQMKKSVSNDWACEARCKQAKRSWWRIVFVVGFGVASANERDNA